jgi:Kef-type K+ transport system membrane component KefB
MESIFPEIAIIICLATVLAIIFRAFKQPAILAYILTGILLGPIGLFHLEHKESLEMLGSIGITLLLFMLGLELRVTELRSIGKNAILAGVIQMFLSAGLGISLAVLFGFSTIASVYIGLALAFSSTVIVVKLLSDKKDLESLHGKISITMLLVQDFFAILTIVFLSGNTDLSGLAFLGNGLMIILKLVVLLGWVILLSKYLFPKIMPIIARSTETLFLFSLAWVFLLTAIVTWEPIGFSIEIGGFLAGLALANSTENFQIVAKMRALRDFFITIFFVMLGLEMTFNNFDKVIIPAIALSVFVILGKPIISMFATGVMGYRKRTSFFVGSALGQVSEFGLILVFLGQTMDVLPSEVVTLMVLVCIVSFVGSSYVIQNMNAIYRKVAKAITIFEIHKKAFEHPLQSEEKISELDDHVVVIGAHQMGQSIIRALDKSGEDVIAVDFNPDIVRKLRSKKINIIFGDIADLEIQEKVGLERAKMVISTIPDIEDNMYLIEGMNKLNKKARVVVMAYEVADAKQLYKAGADYVVLPQLAGGRHLAKILIEKKHLELIEDYKSRDLKSWI